MSPRKAASKAEAPFVIIRTYSAGVHFGRLAERSGKEVRLTETRRIWYWKGAASLSELALRGVKHPTDCRFTVTLPEITLTEAIEIIPCSAEAVANIQAVPEWTA